MLLFFREEKWVYDGNLKHVFSIDVVWNCYHKCVSGQETIHLILGMIRISVLDPDPYPIIAAGGGLQSLTDCLVI